MAKSNQSKDKILVDVNTALVHCLNLMRRDLVIISKSFNSFNSNTSKLNKQKVTVLNNADLASFADNEYLMQQNNELITQNNNLNKQLTNLMQLIGVHTKELNQLNTFIELVMYLLKVVPLVRNSDNSNSAQEQIRELDNKQDITNSSNASCSENPNSSNKSNENLGCAMTVCCSNTANSLLSNTEVKL